MNEDILNSPLDASYKFTKVTFNVFLCHSRQKVITIISHFNIYIVGYLILRKASFLYPWLREICHFVECIISYSFPVLTIVIRGLGRESTTIVGGTVRSRPVVRGETENKSDTSTKKFS